MIYRTYGRTGKKISAVGFGGMRFENPNDVDRCAELLMHAFDKGINYFDTAPMYFKGKSEKIFGKAIPEMKKSGRDFFISTKSMAKKPGVVRMDLEKSLERLGTDSVDFYHVWCVLSEGDYSARKQAGVIEEFRKIKEEGLAGHIGISTHMSGNEIARLLDTEEYEGITLGYSAINFPFREEGVEAAVRKNLGVVIMNPLGGGSIVNNPDAFSFIKLHPDQTMVEASLHFLFSNDGITSALVGFSKKEHIDQAACAVESFRPYKTEEIEDLKRGIQDDFEGLCTTCGYCNVCPEKIRVWTFMESYNHFIINSSENVVKRLKFYWVVPPDELEKCISCGRCEEACTQHLPILERFEKLRKIIERK